MKRWKKWSIFALCIVAGIVVLIFAIHHTVRDYPRIVRSAYYRYPVYAFQAMYAENIARKPVNRSAAIAILKENGLTPTPDIQFLYLTHKTGAKGDKSIFDRHFSLLCKSTIISNESSFWRVTVATGEAYVATNTGRIIYLTTASTGITIPKYL